MYTQIVEIQPRELKFLCLTSSLYHFDILFVPLSILTIQLGSLVEVKKQSSCAVHLANVTDQYVAFKVKTTSPKKYCVRPNVGIIKPKSTCDFTVTMQAQKSAPPEMQCKDKFLIQSTVVPFGTTEDDIVPSMFVKESEKYIEEVKLRVSLSIAPDYPEKPLANVILNQESSFKSSSPKEVNEPVLLPVNGATKQDPSYETIIPKDKLQNGVENFPPDDTVTEKLESITSVKNVEEFRSVKDDMKAAPPKDEEFYLVKDEVKPVKDLDETNLKLMKDIEELKSKISTMDSELVKAKYMIEKLKEEKSNTIREKELLKQELATSRKRTVVRKVRAGFPPLFVCMVALISLVIGLLLRA
ncbi:vesicle-associated membrane protein [Striga asiatica]|uniref:Vesicle-associated membrane protein n=1 Tax=Striga asiatica TaxID=4170 RepID=A0A5A7QYL6_STRAF|nr:vesicle-associated membrane protein [Striga asiatica]